MRWKFQTALALLFLVGSTSGFADTLWFTILDREVHPPFDTKRVGILSLSWPAGTTIYDNQNLTVSVWEGTKPVETFPATSGRVSGATQRRGGKEHDTWTTPKKFIVSGSGRVSSVYMDLHPLDKSAFVNNGVRDAGAHVTLGRRRLELSRLRYERCSDNVVASAPRQTPEPESADPTLLP